jgi:S1-C subfamily serine protease
MDVTTIPQGTGSGFIWDKRGHVVTNYHVVKGASGGIKVTLIDSTTCSAKIVGVDETKDIAVLKLDIPDGQASRLQAVELGRSAVLKVGQKVFAIGNPFGLDHTMTSVQLLS